MSIGIIIFIVFFLLLALLRLDLAVLLVIAALPAYLLRFSFLGLPLTLLELMILISFAIWFFKDFAPRLKILFRRDGQRRPYPFSWEIILTITIAFFAAGIAGFSNSALGIWKAYFFEPILLFILTFNLFREKKDWPKILGALLISALGIALLAIYQKITGQFIFNEFWATAATRRVVSWFGYPNAVGLYLGPLIMIFLGWFFSEPFRRTLSRASRKIIIIITITISLLAVYFARSEGALIGLLAALFVFGLFSGKKPRLTTIIIAIFLLGGIFLYPAAREITLEKITLNDLSGQIRQRQWKETFLTMQGTKFITGAGLSNYQASVKPVHQEGIFFNSDHLGNFDEQLRASSTLRTKYWQPVEIYLYPHNILLNFWSELGLAGALLFTWIIGKYLFLSLRLSVSFNREKRREKYLSLGLMSAMIVIVVHGLVDVPYFKNDLAPMFWLLIALLGAVEHEQKYGATKIAR